MRLIPWGTPSRTKQYLFPGGLRPYFWISLAAGLGVAVVLTAVLWGGRKTVASPGRLSSPHAPFEAKCAACHAPSVADVRCEYCHDPFGSNRMRNAGHVWFGTKDPVRVAKAKQVDCARCHSDHHGRDYRMVRVSEKDCAPCHFRGMSVHPEFLRLKPGAPPVPEGIHFPHKRHLEEMQKAQLDRCQYCHEPTRNRRGFEPLSFDRHCARCHLKNGSMGATDPMPRAAVTSPEDIGAPWAQAEAASVQKLPRDKFVVSKLLHADPWIIYNLWKIAREVDPQGLAAKRVALLARIDALNYQLREPPTRGMKLKDLKARQAALQKTAAALAGDPARSADLRRAELALARVRVQIELGPLEMTAPRPRDRSALQADLKDLKSQLADFDIAASGAPAAPVTGDARDLRLTAVKAMTVICAKCHIYNGALMAPVRAGVAVLERARFNHLPHVQQAGCESCHKVAASTKAEDLNLPGVARCQSCHRTGKSRSDCAECHTYHPLTEPWPPI
jgi:predicted CXXCH cytochrome family protein